MNAYEELRAELKRGEKVEGICFGDWGWGGYSEPEPNPIPLEKRNCVLTLKKAKPLMQSWEFGGGFGAPDCYATYIWTNKRVGYVVQYDGATALHWMPRNPVDCAPEMPGG